VNVAERAEAVLDAVFGHDLGGVPAAVGHLDDAGAREHLPAADADHGNVVLQGKEPDGPEVCDSWHG